MRKPGYFVYGEGSITHSDDRPCEHHVQRIHHPQIQRTAWPSRWHYYRHFAAIWWHERWMRSVARSGYFDRQRKKGITRDYMRNIPMAWLFRLGFKLVGDPFPMHPTVWAPLLPEESIYTGGAEESDRWDKIRSMTEEEREAWVRKVLPDLPHSEKPLDPAESS